MSTSSKANIDNVDPKLGILKEITNKSGEDRKVFNSSASPETSAQVQTCYFITARRYTESLDHKCVYFEMTCNADISNTQPTAKPSPIPLDTLSHLACEETFEPPSQVRWGLCQTECGSTYDSDVKSRAYRPGWYLQQSRVTNKILTPLQGALDSNKLSIRGLSDLSYIKDVTGKANSTTGGIWVKQSDGKPPVLELDPSKWRTITDENGKEWVTSVRWQRHHVYDLPFSMTS